MKTLTCNACEKPFTGRARRRFCDSCLTSSSFRNGTYNRTEGFDLASSATRMRMAIETATAALEMGLQGEALEALYAVEAPARLAVRKAAASTSGRCDAVVHRRDSAGRVFERVACYLPAGHFFAQRHEGNATGCGAYQWNDEESAHPEVPAPRAAS